MRRVLVLAESVAEKITKIRRILPKPAINRLAVAALYVLAQSACADRNDPLPSWNDGATKTAIVEFVSGVTTETDSRYVPPEERIAVFDNDGTLWSEQPVYNQLAFAIERVRALAPEHPEWLDTEPFSSLLAGDMAGVMAGGHEAIFSLVFASHAGMTTDEFAALVSDWLATARHPVTGLGYRDMVYQPMLELLDYLRSNGFKTYIVSGGGIEFMRPWTYETYGVPPEQVIGSSIKTQFEMRNGNAVLVRLPELNFVDDGPGKPIGINQHIGRRPIAAFGNSDGDLQMLQWATTGDHPGFALIVHHTDEEREWAYDSPSPIGQLDKALRQAKERNWVVVDMKADWKIIYPPRKSRP